MCMYIYMLQDELNEDKKQASDLKAKGLCLVPLACISYLPEDSSNGGRIGSIWPPLAAANFNRRTFWCTLRMTMLKKMCKYQNEKEKLLVRSKFGHSHCNETMEMDNDPLVINVL